MFEIGKNVKIVYRDGTYSKVVQGSILAIDENMYYVQDKKGSIGIGKQSVISISEVWSDENGKRTSE